MEIKHEDIINSIEGKHIKDRKEWEHLFILKHKFQNNIRRYLLSALSSMGELKEEEKVWKCKLTPCHEAIFHGIECLETEEDYGFEGCYNGDLNHPDPRPGHAIWINKLHAEKLFRMFANQKHGE
jgi:hypothetical protein